VRHHHHRVATLLVIVFGKEQPSLNRERVALPVQTLSFSPLLGDVRIRVRQRSPRSDGADVNLRRLIERLANQCRRREPVHSRHAQIHQYEIEVLRGVACNSFRSVVDPYGSASENGQIALSNLCIDGLVFDQELHIQREVLLEVSQCLIGPPGMPLLNVPSVVT